ncbi:MAG: hypothetical protein KU37_07955 [Sulfuricurvum sp. PC08-66]|nr:MAG: hypothetical protein KU37_07955 [Sulfuricurvum sp. PC08-66]
MTLSKSQFIRGMKCHKSLWLLKHQPHLRTPSDSAQEALFASGYTVGDAAKSLYPDGVEIAFDRGNYDAMIAQTQALIYTGARTLYEATFKSEGLFAMVDILHRGANGWEIYEVKASTHPKDYHIWDASLQLKILRDLGYEVSKVAIVHINNQFTKTQESIDPRKLLTITDITAQAYANTEAIEEHHYDMRMMLEGEMPAMDIGAWCGKFYACDFEVHCWSHIPSPSVFDLYRLSSEKKFALYAQNILTFADIRSAKTKLNVTQKLQIDTHFDQERHIDTKVITKFLDKLVYPLSYFDFETFNDAVPRYYNQKPYAQVPFQYSLHIESEEGEVVAKAFLGDEMHDPRRALVESMLRDLPSSGSIVAYNMSFEITQIQALAKLFGEYEEALLALVPRFVDLIEPFRNRGYYVSAMGGSFSIKSVLPALFGDDERLSYKKLTIQNGGMASETFARLHLESDETKRREIREALLEYCHLDTLAMVKIVERLRSVV